MMFTVGMVVFGICTLAGVSLTVYNKKKTKKTTVANGNPEDELAMELLRKNDEMLKEAKMKGFAA